MRADQPSRVRMPSSPSPSARPTEDRDAEAAWARLAAVLDAAGAAGRRIDLWWRDDDAVAPNPALDRLLDLTAAAEAPLALAVIPAHTGPALAAHLDGRPAVAVLVHGWRHHTPAPDDTKQTEIGDHRPLEAVAT